MSEIAAFDQADPITIAAIIPCYNYRTYVADAIESALLQSPPFDEIIVVDDGSTDGSPEVIRRYADRVKIIEKPNGGQISASREALAACHSEYVYFLDADDFILEGFLRTIRPLLEDRPVKLQFQLHGVDAQAHPKHSVFPTYPASYGSERMREDNLSLGFYICPPTTGNVYRRETLAALPLDQLNQRESIDGPPALVMPYLGPVKSINVPLGCYRLHGSNLFQWNRPSAELFRHETKVFLDRWSEARLLIKTDMLPQVPVSSVFVLERVLMIAGLESTHVSPSIILAFIRGLLKTNIPTKLKIIISLWACLFLVPSRQFKSYLVSARRAPESRPAAFKWFMAFLRNKRISAHAETMVASPLEVRAKETHPPQR